MRDPWTYKVEPRDGNLVVVFDNVEGVGNANVGQLSEEVLAHIDHESASALIVDLSKLDYVPSAFLGLLLLLRRDLPRRHVDLKLVGARSVVREVLEVTKLHRLFHQYATLDAALGSSSSLA